jgi:phosphomethylpyrimidine synthase
MITIHPTARRDIIALAGRRNVPWTSRGGGLVVTDLLAGSQAQNAYLDILPDLAPVARARGATISIGATFRSATVMDADDEAQREEIAFQGELAAQLLRDGCSVIIEGPGHAAPAAIRGLAERMRKTGCPIMPLGPIPTDLAIGQDHISAAIGATLMGLEGAAHILAAVTREEHTGGVPQIISTLEAIDAARVAARVIDLHRYGPGLEDSRVVAERSDHRTCVVGRTVRGCSRCGDACPL